jgi:hypothetical protein
MSARLAFALGFSSLLFATTARAGVITDENQKPGTTDWQVSNDGTAAEDGVVDVYPSMRSISPGDSVALKIRSTARYDVHVFRMGWYGGAGAREVATFHDLPANPQPYPRAESQYGFAAPNWSDSVVVTTDATWTPGLYVARVDQPSGEQGATFFVVRDDALPSGEHLPILAVVSTFTHEAYNAWPSQKRGGKSLYAFNSTEERPAESSFTQAVKVSLDRPFETGAGLADVPNYEYPYLRFLEKNGWDVAWCTDEDLHSRPDLVAGRRVITGAGHWEYWSTEMFDNALAARDEGTSFLFLTGDTLSWHVRLEDSTLVAYKESWEKDPEQLEAVAAREAGDIDRARAHFARVTRQLKELEYDPEHGIDERRPGMLLTGVLSAGMFDGAGDFPWADFVVRAPKHWIFSGTGMKSGDRIANVMGYEYDSALFGLPQWDAFRPAGQERLGSIVDLKGTPHGSAASYRTGASEVVSLGAIAFVWALDDFAPKNAGITKPTVDARAQRMVNNALHRWTASDPLNALDGDSVYEGEGDTTPDPDPFADAPKPPPQPTDTTPPAQSLPADVDASATPAASSCSYGTHGSSNLSLAALGLVAIFVSRLRSRRA